MAVDSLAAATLVPEVLAAKVLAVAVSKASSTASIVRSLVRRG